MNNEYKIREIMASMTATAKTPKGLANELKRQFVAKFGLKEKYVHVYSPKESAERGLRNNWSLCYENSGDMCEWAVDLCGFSDNINNNKHVFCEPYHGWALTLKNRK